MNGGVLPTISCRIVISWGYCFSRRFVCLVTVMYLFMKPKMLGVLLDVLAVRSACVSEPKAPRLDPSYENNPKSDSKLAQLGISLNGPSSGESVDSQRCPGWSTYGHLDGVVWSPDEPGKDATATLACSSSGRRRA